MSLNIVSANLSHSKDIWRWRNDPITRSFSKNTNEVSWEDHDSWFRKSLTNPNRYLYIGVSATPEYEESIGIVRFDIFSSYPEHSKVSINIAPRVRGKRFGYLLLKEGTENFAREIKRSIRIFAEVNINNLASIRLFTSSGYSSCDHDNTNYYQYFLDLM
tara:strand:- start:155 stop:634 length:480 start_codon:yes stop_codon:yes gene_type:complete